MPPGLVRVEDVPIYLLGEDVIPQEVPGEPGMIESRPGDCDAPLGQTEPVGETPVVRYAPFRAGNGAVPASHVLEPERHFPARAAVRGQEARTGDIGLRVCRRETVLVGQGLPPRPCSRPLLVSCSAVPPRSYSLVRRYRRHKAVSAIR